MNLEDVMLSYISQHRKINITCTLICILYSNQTHEAKNKKGGYQRLGFGGMGECCPKGTKLQLDRRNKYLW
jgi:hypothetical protein